MKFSYRLRKLTTLPGYREFRTSSCAPCADGVPTTGLPDGADGTGTARRNQGWAALTGSGSWLSTAATRGADGNPVGSRWEGLASTAPIRRGRPRPIVQVPGALATAQGRGVGHGPGQVAVRAGPVCRRRTPDPLADSRPA